MSLSQKPANLQPLSNYIRFTKPKKRILPKLKLYKPNGYQQQTTNFKLRTDQNNGSQNSFIEDSRKSNFTFRAFLQIETCLLILSVTSFVVQIHFGQYNDMNLQLQSNILLMTQSAITLAILILLAVRYKLNIQLKKQQKIQSLNATIFHSDYLPFMLLEMSLCIIHPTYFSKDVVVILFQPYDQIDVEHQLNDLLALIMLCRVYLILRALIVSTIFSGTRAGRLCRVYGCEHNIIFAVKSIMKQIPLRTLGFLFLLMILIYGQGLRISQHNLIKYFPSGFDLSNYSNCFWAIIITMGTVGYGDYFPRTYPGRGIIFLASISGVIMTSLLIITLSDYLSMNPYETKAHLTQQRLKLREQLEKVALETIKQTSLLSFNLKSQDPKIKMNYDRIKKQTASVKVVVRKLQTMMDTDNVSQQMNRLFEILEMSLKQIYQNQMEVKELLESLYNQEKEQLREIKFSFSSEIQQTIKQY